MTAPCVSPFKAPNGSEPRARLFLSYGRKDAGDLARRLKADMEEQGFWVWLDTHEIRTGRTWDVEIRDGLRNTQVVVAMLSPHAVRVTGPEAPDAVDGVCLDEISFARFARPPIPIVPVMAVACEPPFCIFRLDYTDLTRWSESEEEYRIGFQRLLGGIEAALRGETIYRRWHHQLQPLEFELLLDEKRRDSRRRHNTARKEGAVRARRTAGRGTRLSGVPQLAGHQVAHRPRQIRLFNNVDPKNTPLTTSEV
jgi:hypothetical protein